MADGVSGRVHFLPGRRAARRRDDQARGMLYAACLGFPNNFYTTTLDPYEVQARAALILLRNDRDR
jgi:hypothetical protein